MSESTPVCKTCGGIIQCECGIAQNTDREIWRETLGDFYSNSIHVTQGGGIGIDVGGTVIVRRAEEWRRLANPQWTREAPTEEGNYWYGDVENETVQSCVVESLMFGGFIATLDDASWIMVGNEPKTGRWMRRDDTPDSPRN